MQPAMRMSWKSLWVFFAILWLSSCNYPGFNGASPTPTGPTATAPAPTSTPVPLAASVSGEVIPLESFETEVSRFEQAQIRSGIDLATLAGYRAQVLDALIDLKLLILGATQHGHEVSSEDVELRIAEIVSARGSQVAFDTWMQENEYSVESFHNALMDEILAAQMVATIAETVALSADQVHARHILVATQDEAENLRARIVEGEDFADIANNYSIDASTRLAGGDLGWFPRGFLLWIEVEVAAFEQAPGEISPVTQSELGYHLVETLEHGEHQLDYEARLSLQEQAVQDWLTDQRQAADIQIFITP